jgi:hypothetical protein
MTIHPRQIQYAKMHIRKTTTSEESTVYSFESFPHYIAHTLLTPILCFSPLYHPYIPFPLYPTFTPSLCCTSPPFPSLHFTTLFTLLDDFHYTFK